ncbi:hypothetical protein M419DRAFT_76979, partial [Trichoderma reesei RUT C-30]
IQLYLDVPTQAATDRPFFPLLVEAVIFGPEHLLAASRTSSARRQKDPGEKEWAPIPRPLNSGGKAVIMRWGGHQVGATEERRGTKTIGGMGLWERQDVQDTRCTSAKRKMSDEEYQVARMAILYTYNYYMHMVSAKTANMPGADNTGRVLVVLNATPGRPSGAVNQQTKRNWLDRNRPNADPNTREIPASAGAAPLGGGIQLGLEPESMRRAWLDCRLLSWGGPRGAGDFLWLCLPTPSSPAFQEANQTLSVCLTTSYNSNMNCPPQTTTAIAAQLQEEMPRALHRCSAWPPSLPTTTLLVLVLVLLHETKLVQ